MGQLRRIQLRHRPHPRLRPARGVGLAVLAPLVLALAPAWASALQCSQLVFRETPATVCRVDLRTDRLQLFLKDAAGAPYKSMRHLAEVLQGQARQLLFAMNAGMFREDFSPLGLLVMDG